VTVFAIVMTERHLDDKVAARLGRAGADKVLSCEGTGLGAPPLDLTHGPALYAAVERIPPLLVLFPAGGAGTQLGPGLASRLGGAFAASADLEIGEAATPLLLGVHAQYNFTPTIALISGYAGTQQLKISLAGQDPMMTGTEVTPIDIGLPIALGYQPTEELYLQVDTKLFTLNISDSANALIGKDTTPAALTAVYNVIPALDVQAAIAMDLTPAAGGVGDTLAFLVGARYYAGQL